MNAKQLYFALAKNSSTKKYFNGIYARDTLVDIQAPPNLIICNTDSSRSRGKHWVLFHLKGGDMIFYDSLGHNFPYYGTEFVNFVNRWSSTYEFVNTRTQPLHTRLCGIYCLYFAYYSCLKWSPSNIVKSMTSPRKVKMYVAQLFVICTYFACPLIQCCVKL